MPSIIDHPMWPAVGRVGLILLMLFLLLVLSASPLGFGAFSGIRPAFLLIAVYYWAVTNPPLLPPPAAFGVGILLDLLSNYPTGLTALVFVLVQWLVRTQRKFLLGQSFAVMWFALMLVAFGAGFLQWGFFSLFNLTVLPLKPMLASALMTGLLFPLAVLPLHAVNRALAYRPPAT